MAGNKGLGSAAEKGLGLIEKIFGTLWSVNEPPDLWHWMILILIAFIVIGLISILTLKGASKVIELLIKLIDAYKSSGLPMWLNAANKPLVRRRKQFCGVLDADLGYLAKAENWNDQHFTDLEAEIETEGGYYASAWDRMRRKKSYGLRKEASLIRAITTSTERAMQLVGEPGSGKSVALRHLAKKLAEQGKKSNYKTAIVPLYLNLREMETGYEGNVTADDVREFVLDNIRRGDADTSAYVKDNWEDYCNRGIWLFLFDSFDEIPAVLHAASGSNIIRNYSQAIRQFLEGMGECKGILASREFKGPEALPWKKLRILSLNDEKQDELIQNSFLSKQQMSLVRQHLASSDSSIGATPLFLTLLCRYIKDEQRAPSNDHDILLQHVERLARREPEYSKRKYHLETEQIIDGAELLARLFAENETLSLAPTLDQIMTYLPESQVPGKSIKRLISALVDCKIGRADVPNAAYGDRRFAFAHRRYQEALFVRYLARHPEAISASELLTNPRWREYAVTLLQTRETDEINTLFDVARTILEERAILQTATWNGSPPLPSNLKFFDWAVEKAVPLLELLQEGLARRLSDIPISLSQAVFHFLEPRWNTGDSFDRQEVLRLGGILPENVLTGYLVETFSVGTVAEREQAFRLAVFAPNLPEITHKYILEMLADEVLLARDRADQLRVEAMAARLPEPMGAVFVIARCVKIRRQLRWLGKISSFINLIIPRQLLERLMKKIYGPGFSLQKNSLIHHGTILSPSVLLAITATLVSMTMIAISEWYKSPNSINIITSILLILGVIILSSILCPYAVRDYGKAVKIADFIEWLTARLTLKNLLSQLEIFGITAIAFLLTIPLGYIVEWAALYALNIELIKNQQRGVFDFIGLGFITIMIVFYVSGSFLIIKKLISDRKLDISFGDRLLTIKSEHSLEISAVYFAKNIDELMNWLKRDHDILKNQESIRALSSLVLDKVRTSNSDKLICDDKYPTCLQSSTLTKRKLNDVRQILEERLERTSSSN